MCLCIDCQGDTVEDVQDLANFYKSLGYKHLPATSMVFEWKWEQAYLGAIGRKDTEAVANIKAQFLKYSVHQTLYDLKRGQLMFGNDFIPSILYHMLNIVGDTFDDVL